MMSVYVLRSDNLVKIGFSDNLRNRVHAIVATVPVPVEFVGHMPGGREVESHFHEVFSAHRFSGEWFVETKAMRAAFDAILIPSLPKADIPEKIQRSAERSSTHLVSERVRNAAAISWPGKSKAEQVDLFAREIGWTRTRAKDFFYANPRLALRAYELQSVEAWLLAFKIAPELRDEV